MDQSEIDDLTKQLGDGIDDLSSVLSSVVKISVTASASKMPLLDRAKMYVLIVYAIESVLFCEFSASCLWLQAYIFSLHATQ